MGLQRGKLVLVVGPSGAGKDTLLMLARDALAERHDIVFQRRVVTRPSGIWEDHSCLTEAEFDEARDRGAFILAWRAHGLSYGIPQQAMELVRDGKIVVCNASRTVVAEASQRFTETRVIHIIASSEERAQRIAARGREAVSGRLQREIRDDVQVVAHLIIDNTGPAEESARAMIAYLRSLTVPANVSDLEGNASL